MTLRFDRKAIAELDRAADRGETVTRSRIVFLSVRGGTKAIAELDGNSSGGMKATAELDRNGSGETKTSAEMDGNGSGETKATAGRVCHGLRDRKAMVGGSAIASAIGKLWRAALRLLRG